MNNWQTFRNFLLRNGRSEVFCKKGILRYYAEFTGKHLYWIPFAEHQQIATSVCMENVLQVH